MIDVRFLSADEARPLRHAVLRPGRPVEEVTYPPDDDPATIHLGAYDGDLLVGVATFFPDPCPHVTGANDWRLRGMATLPSHQGRGIGGDLLERGVAEAAARGASCLWCNGRVGAARFYERHGFVPHGEPFEVPHTGPHFVFRRPL